MGTVQHVKRFEYPTPWGGVLALVVILDPEDTEHVLEGSCWCQPKAEDVLPDGRYIVHRRDNDSPYVEVGPTPEGLTAESEIVF